MKQGRINLLFFAATGAMTLFAGVAVSEKSPPAPMQNSASKAVECPVPGTLSGEPGWEMAASATFTAEQSGDSIVIRARGTNPTPNFVVQFIIRPDGKLSLYRKRPGGMQLQVMTGFSACATLKGRGAVESIVIVDRAGDHTVKVEKASEKGK